MRWSTNIQNILRSRLSPPASANWNHAQTELWQQMEYHNSSLQTLAHPILVMKWLDMWKGWNHPITSKDPESNGFAESFMKLLCKLIHTGFAEGKYPKREFHGYPLQYRATPHTTLGKSQAKVLFRRKIQTKLPQYHPTSQRNLRMCILITTISCYRKSCLTNNIKRNRNQFILVTKLCWNRRKAPPSRPLTPIITMSSRSKGVK